MQTQGSILMDRETVRFTPQIAAQGPLNQIPFFLPDTQPPQILCHSHKPILGMSAFSKVQPRCSFPHVGLNSCQGSLYPFGLEMLEALVDVV